MLRIARQTVSRRLIHSVQDRSLHVPPRPCLCRASTNAPLIPPSSRRLFPLPLSLTDFWLPVVLALIPMPCGTLLFEVSTSSWRVNGACGGAEYRAVEEGTVGYDLENGLCVGVGTKGWGAWVCGVLCERAETTTFPPCAMGVDSRGWSRSVACAADPSSARRFTCRQVSVSASAHHHGGRRSATAVS